MLIFNLVYFTRAKKPPIYTILFAFMSVFTIVMRSYYCPSIL